jgi:hypothetical protein
MKFPKHKKCVLTLFKDHLLVKIIKKDIQLQMKSLITHNNQVKKLCVSMFIFGLLQIETYAKKPLTHKLSNNICYHYSETLEFNAYQIEIESNAGSQSYQPIIRNISCRIRFDFYLVRNKFESFTVSAYLIYCDKICI